MNEQKGKDTIKVDAKLIDRVEAQWDVQSNNWRRGFISGIDLNPISDAFRKQSAELEKKLRIRQKRLEDLDAVAMKKEGGKVIQPRVRPRLLMRPPPRGARASAAVWSPKD